MDTGFEGRGSDGASLGKGGYDLGLSRRQIRIRNCVEIR